MSITRIKPIIDIVHRGKKIAVVFTPEQRSLSLRYDILVDGKVTKANLFDALAWRYHARGKEMTRTTKVIQYIIFFGTLLVLVALMAGVYR